MPVDLGVLLAGARELGGVDDLDEPSVDDPRMLAGEHHAYEFLGLGESAGLDDDDVDACGGPSQPVQVLINLDRAESLTTAPIRLPPLRCRRWLSSVVLPEPRKLARPTHHAPSLNRCAHRLTGPALSSLSRHNRRPAGRSPDSGVDMATQNQGVRTLGSAATAGLAFAVGILAVLVAQQRRFKEQRLREPKQRRRKHERAEEWKDLSAIHRFRGMAAIGQSHAVGLATRPTCASGRSVRFHSAALARQNPQLHEIASV